MSFATTHMIAFAYDTAITDNHSTNHGVGTGVLTSVFGQLQTPPHVFFVF